MSTDVKCAFLFDVKRFLMCSKIFILGTFKGVRINPLKTCTYFYGGFEAMAHVI